MFLFVILLSLFILLFAPFIFEFYDYSSTNPESSSVLMILFFAVFLLWERRDQLKNIKYSQGDIFFSRSGFVLLIGGVLFYVFGVFTYVLFIQAIAFIIILIASILFIYGNYLFRLTGIPILFLLFIVPFPTQVYRAIADPLKYFIAHASTGILLWFNIPLLIEGNIIHLPSISLQIHETCSGIQTTLSMTAIGTAFAYLFLKSYRYRIALITLSIPLGVITNIFRVVIIATVAYLFDAQLALDFHGNAWLFVTPAGLLVIFLAGYIFRCLERKDSLL